MTETGEPNPRWPIGCELVLSAAGRGLIPVPRGIYMGESRKTSEQHRLIRVRPVTRKAIGIFWGGYWKRARP